MRKFEKAAQLVNATEVERNLYEAFMVSGFDLYSIGSTSFRQGAFVGIPLNYTYQSADEIPKGEVMVKGYDQVKWSSKGGNLLQEGVILTEEEQVFGMAREMMQLRGNHILYRSLIGSFSIFMYYSMTSRINHVQRLFARPLALRLILYSISGLFCSGVYFALKDALQITVENNVDEEMGKFPEEYIRAGIGFYDKILKKNVAIRELTGDSIYTAKGNLNDLIRVRTTPFTSRKKKFENYLKELTDPKEKVSDEKEKVSEEKKAQS